MDKDQKIFSKIFTRIMRRLLVGMRQPWRFDPLPPGWRPPVLKKTSLYLHVPFCRNCCPYCPYYKVAWDAALLDPYKEAVLREVDGWAGMVGPAQVTSIYIGGGTPTTALNSVTEILKRIRQRFQLTGETCIETNPSDVSETIIQKMHDAGVSRVSLGVQSFDEGCLRAIGRDYEPAAAKKALSLLGKSSFDAVNVDLMFALPGQTVQDILRDLEEARSLGADQITAYPLFTFPYTTVGQYLRLRSVRMPDLKTRKAQFQAISHWCISHGFKRVSVWGFAKSPVPRYSSVTRDSYIGFGPGAGSSLPEEFVINTFDLDSWMHSVQEKGNAIALRMPFTHSLSCWWWLYWRLYDTRIPMGLFTHYFGRKSSKARALLKVLELSGLAANSGDETILTESGVFWVHLLQNHFALDYVNTLWTHAQSETWPQTVIL